MEGRRGREGGREVAAGVQEEEAKWGWRGGGGGGLLRQRVVSREGARLKLFYGHRLFSPSPSPGEDLGV